MRNHNVYYVSGDIEKKLKNGEFRRIIKFPGIKYLIDDLAPEYKHDIEHLDPEQYPFKETLYKFRSPFRIGPIHINSIHLSDDILIKTDYKNWKFDVVKFKNAIIAICRQHKNTIIALPIYSQLMQFKSVIIKVLEDNVRDTKVVIIEK